MPKKYIPGPPDQITNSGQPLRWCDFVSRPVSKKHIPEPMHRATRVEGKRHTPAAPTVPNRPEGKRHLSAPNSQQVTRPAGKKCLFEYGVFARQVPRAEGKKCAGLSNRQTRESVSDCLNLTRPRA